MNNFVFDETNGLWYQRPGYYYILCIVLHKTDIEPIGRWGRAHLEYIKEHHSARYAQRIADGSLFAYLAEVDTLARQRFELLTAQMAQSRGVTEELKANDMMAWIGAMNNIRSAVKEIIDAEVIFV